MALKNNSGTQRVIHGDLDSFRMSFPSKQSAWFSELPGLTTRWREGGTTGFYARPGDIANPAGMRRQPPYPSSSHGSKADASGGRDLSQVTDDKETWVGRRYFCQPGEELR